MENFKNERQKNGNGKWKIWLPIVIVFFVAIVYFNLDMFKWAFGLDRKDNAFDTEYNFTIDVDTTRDSSSIVMDTIALNDKDVASRTVLKSNGCSSYYSDYDSEDDELKDDPEYREGGKYDPALYHTDYGKDQEERRRRFIDNDGFDDDDGYDEYYGYEHENARSDQWKDDD